MAFEAALPEADDGAGIASAYRTNDARAVRNNRIILDVITHYVREGGEAEMSMLYPDALAVFGPDSTHLKSASQGQAGAGAHYQATAAGGRYTE